MLVAPTRLLIDISAKIDRKRLLVAGVAGSFAVDTLGMLGSDFDPFLDYLLDLLFDLRLGHVALLYRCP